MNKKIMQKKTKKKKKTVPKNIFFASKHIKTGIALMKVLAIVGLFPSDA